MSAPTDPGPSTLTALVRAAGRDLDDMGPPGIGRYYLVLEIPTGPNAMIQKALTSGRIQVHAASCRLVPERGPS
jgi:hypothetical protein